MRIGFIGLGNMGAPMARNLVAAGHAVEGFDTALTECSPLTLVADAVAAAADKDAVITMLPNGSILCDVYRQIIPAGRSGTLFMDCSTVDVDSAKAAHGMAAEHAMLSIDAPVSGGIAGAAAGTLTFMAGGKDNAVAAAQPLLDVMGGKTVHCGAPGAGQAAKICNNMILGISMLGVCEAFALGARLDLDLSRLYEVVSTSSGSCWSVNQYCPVPGVGPVSPADNHYTPGFAAELMLKDLLLSQQAANSGELSTPMGELATQLYQHFVDNGGKGQDFSALFQALSDTAGGGNKPS